MTTYEKIKKLNDLVQRMSGMYSNVDKRSQQIANGYELRALEMIKELRFEDKSPEAGREYQEVCNHFAYFRKLEHKAYVAENRESQAFDCIYSQTKDEAEKELKAKVGEDAKDLFFWTVYVHENGEEEKL